MKIILLLSLLFVFPIFSFEQSLTDSTNFTKDLLFDQFKDGSVLMKSGAIANAPLNYNTNNQTLFFMKDGQVMSLDGTEMIDTVYIGDKKFVPVNNKIYEVVTTGLVALYVSYYNKPRPLEATTDHDGTTRKTGNEVSNTVSDTYTMRNYKGKFSVEFMKDYWLKKDDKLYKVNTARQFVKPFSSEMRSKIENYIETNHIAFDDEKDLIKLVGFCNNLQ